MATRTPKAAPAAPAAPAAQAIAPQPSTIWAFTKAAAAFLGKAMGLVQVPKATADQLIASGDAVKADGRTGYPFREGFEPRGFPPGPAPAPLPVKVLITSVSAAGPTVATVGEFDASKLANGDRLLLDQTAGATLPALDGQVGTVGGLAGTTFSLVGIDLTGLVVDGVTATGTKQLAGTPAPPAPAASPALAPPAIAPPADPDIA